ncbi:hypothetical protein FN846DRAFT_894034 [Sphaerosporella brunnea]|uniref:Uncharacterized protein n=1 Tax=Sphaerosporella brunnea TaxID=1250544 RepID=A0A5J5EJI8_9PEZI|nr:hypothetical protein FN846DRAFT_894034 [Sphaerosporella brunnea]
MASSSACASGLYARCWSAHMLHCLLTWRKRETKSGQGLRSGRGLRKLERLESRSIPNVLCSGWLELNYMLFRSGWGSRLELFARSDSARLPHYPGRDQDDFCFSTGWFLNFLSRNAISVHAPTNTGQKIPADYPTVVINFLRFLRRNTGTLDPFKPAVTAPPLPIPTIGCVPIYRVGNMDQTPLPFEFLDKGTYDEAAHSWEKRQATIMVTSFGDGVPHVPAIVIFTRTPDEDLQRPRNSREKRLMKLPKRQTAVPSALDRVSGRLTIVLDTGPEQPPVSNWLACCG